MTYNHPFFHARRGIGRKTGKFSHKKSGDQICISNCLSPLTIPYDLYTSLIEHTDNPKWESAYTRISEQAKKPFYMFKMQRPELVMACQEHLMHNCVKQYFISPSSTSGSGIIHGSLHPHFITKIEEQNSHHRCQPDNP